MKRLILILVSTPTSVFAGNWIFVILALAITGCGMTTNVTKSAPYSHYIGRTLILKRPAFLFRFGITPAVKLGDKWTMSDLGHYPHKITRLIDLPPGTKLTISDVHRIRGFDGFGDEIYADGFIVTPAGAAPVRFEYHWGSGALHRAPWEDDTTAKSVDHQ